MTDQIDSRIVEDYERCKIELAKHGLKIKPNGRFFDIHDGDELFVFTGSVDLIRGFAGGLTFAAKKKRKKARRKK